jgi:hypothetical protein
MRETLEAEHARLLEQTEALARQHRWLESHPRDIPGHVAHRAELRAQIERLHEHVRRLRQRGQLSG